MTRSILLKSVFGSVPCLLIFVTAAAAQTARELNRSGRWAEAAEVALRAATDVDAPLSERCQAFSDLIYANVRLERSAEAAEHLEAFDRTCAEAVAGTWIETETNRLRTEINRPQIEQDHMGRPTDEDWAVADDPADLGLDVEALDSHRTLCESSGADACLVVYDGRIVQEWYGSDYGEPIEAMSGTKSVTGLLVGMVIEDGKLSEDDGVAHFIPEWTAGAEGGVTVRHLLTMTSGLLGSHVPRPADSHVGGVTNKDSLVFSLPLVTAPGTAWAYSNEGAYLLSPLLRRAQHATPSVPGWTGLDARNDVDHAARHRPDRAAHAPARAVGRRTGCAGGMD